MVDVSEIDEKFGIKSLIICKQTGEYLVDLILDSDINPILLSSFVGALSMFGKGSLGKIEEISIKGLDVEMIIVSEYDLILIAILEKEFSQFSQQGMRKEIENLLDIFYSLYKDTIEDSTACIDTSNFNDFKEVLFLQIKDYFEKIKNIEKENQPKDFGFISNAIIRMKNGKIKENE